MEVPSEQRLSLYEVYQIFSNADSLNCAVSYLIHYLFYLTVSVTDRGFKLYETRGPVYIGQLTLVKSLLLVADHFISPVFETVRL